MSSAEYAHVSPWFPDWLAWAGQRTWCAIDFETMDAGRDSACSIALVRVVEGRIEQSGHSLCKPPRQNEENTPIHGITWDDVAHRPPLSQVWESLRDLWPDCAYFVAHNVGFDRTVLSSTLESQAAQAPDLPWWDTVNLAKAIWPEWRDAGGYGLSNITQRLGIEHQHHNALSDALACARIVLAAREDCRVQLGDFEDQWKAKYIVRHGLPVSLIPLKTSYLTCSRNGSTIKMHCTRCAHDDTLYSGPARFAGPVLESFAKRHQTCSSAQDKELRKQHYEELGLLCAPALDIPEPTPPVQRPPVTLPPREKAPLAKSAVRSTSETAAQATLFASERGR